MKNYKKMIFLPLLLLVFTFSGCNSSSNDKPYTTLEKNKNSELIWLSLSEEAKEYRELVRETHENLSFTEENYPSLLKTLKERTKEQAFPQTTTKNQLNKLQYGENDVYTLDNGSYDNIVLYIHGGAYVYEILKNHVSFADKLVDELNAKVYMPIYPLAPQATYKETYALVDEVYQDLLNQHKRIFIMGDSAGGGFALAFTEYLKEKGEILPARIIIFSPWVDVTLSNPEIPSYEEIDLQLAAYAPREIGKLWAGDLDTKDPLISPIYGNLEGLPPTLIFVGTDEIMCPDDTLLYSKMKELGQEVSLVYGEGLWHVFPLSNIPEQAECIQIIKNFVK